MSRHSYDVLGDVFLTLYIIYLQKGDRAKRTHQLCNIGGAVKALAPGIEELPKPALYELMEQIFTLPEVRAIIDAATSREGK